MRFGKSCSLGVTAVNKRAIILFTCLWILLPSYPVQGTEDIWGELLSTGEYYTLLGPEEQVLWETGHQMYLQDQYLGADNNLYEVVEVDEKNRLARTELVERTELEVFPWNELRKELGLTVIEGTQQTERGKIALYHTHNAESYVPSDGAESINGPGGIHQVGQAFADALRELGIGVDYSETLHLPHDRGAYRRSRETVLELLSGEPDAVFDVHRDAAPQSAYAIQLQDEWMTQVMFVVGRQNQNLGVNRKYAQSLKAIGDDLFPGLIRGIFYGRGNYNQDLSPLSLLLEVGAHTNSRPAAERGISLFAEVVDLYFYGPVAEAGRADQGRAAMRSVWGVLAFTGVLAIAVYVINVGGFGAALERVRARLGRSRLE